MASDLTVADLVDFIVRLEDDPSQRAVLDGAPYDFFSAAVADGLVDAADVDGFARTVGAAVRRGLVTFETELGGAMLPPPEGLWTSHAFQSRLGYHSTVAGRQLVALYRQRHRATEQPSPRSRERRPADRDVFISHAGEDKDAIARPVAEELRRRGCTVWFDEYELVLGDSLRRKISEGLASSLVGLVILSPSFFSKPWPQWELDGLTARWISGETNVILPVWHNVELADVRRHSAPLADLLAVRSDEGVETVVERVVAALDRLRAGERPEAALAEATRPLHVGALPADDGAIRVADADQIHEGMVLLDSERGLWVKYGGAKFQIPSRDVVEWLFPRARVYSAPDSVIDELPTVPDDGAILREEPAPIYVIYGGAKFLIPDVSTLRRLYDVERIRNMWPGALEHLPLVPRDGTLLVEEASTQVYEIVGGKRYAVRLDDPTRRPGLLWRGELDRFPPG